MGRDFYFFEFGLAFFDRRLVIERIDQHIEVWRHVLAFLHDHVEHVRIHFVIGIVHGLAPAPLALRRQRGGRAFVLMHRREMPDQIAEKMDDSAGIFVAETTKLTISAARIEREDRLEMRRRLLGDYKLLGAKAGNADHADIAVAPVPRRDPFYQIVTIPLARATGLRLADAARRADDMHIATRDQKLGVAGFHWAGP